MGAIDLVIQVESPPSVASGMQRIGRAGHRIDEPSTGVIIPKYRGDLLASAAITEGMMAGAVEPLRYPRNPLDIVAQQIVAMTAMDDWSVDDLERVIHQAAPFAELPRSAFEGVLDMLSGRYPVGRVRGASTAHRVGPHRGHRALARGLEGRRDLERRHDPGPRALRRVPRGRRKGQGPRRRARRGDGLRDAGGRCLPSRRVELARRGDHARPRHRLARAGRAGKMPFWHGENVGRPLEFGRAIGALARRHALALAGGCDDAARDEARLDEGAARNLLQYLRDQEAATGSVPDDHTIVVERYLDDMGDWRVCILSHFGARVHAPWAMAIGATVRERTR